MNWLDEKYISFLSPQLQHFKKVKERIYNFRCPLCGDSDKNDAKARGYIYLKPAITNHYNFKCFNCGMGYSFKNFLKLISPALHQEYTFEKIKENKPEEVPQFENNRTTFDVEYSMDDLADNCETSERGKQYLQDRLIPQKHWNRFYHVENFFDMVTKLVPNFEGQLPNDERIIIPFYNQDGIMTHLQGRAMGRSGMRYITITIDETQPKVFGLDKVDTKQDHIFIVEGPFDSTFIPNCLAMGGADLTLNLAGNLVYIFDNEPRNRQIVNRVDKYIHSGYNVCLFSDTFRGKDINEMVKNGHSIDQIMQYINQNIVSGLRAMNVLSYWKKV